jgi:TolB-like protein/Tfp pilus assembly protein PilF
MRAFFAELKRRNVYKVAAAYAVVAWLLIQVATQTFPFFEVPNWAVRLVILLIIAGFPIALVCAWAYEMTPVGLKKAGDVPPEQSIRRSTGRKLDFFIIGGLALAVGVLLFQRWHSPSVAAVVSRSTTKSIAVLPFDNRSEDKTNGYFADGIQDEILTRLAKIADLKVISRTSTQHYKSAPENLREIARQLGVTNVLEGSVQKSQDQVRVNVQLINAETDSHLWAESYDRTLTDIFGVETEVAKAIADTLNAKLTGREERAISVRPTENPEAYDQYLRGLAIWTQYTTSPLYAEDAIRYFGRAVELDPQFAFAWARLSIAQSRVFWSRSDPTPERRNMAMAALEKALALQPQAGETQLAKGFFHYWVLSDFDTALEAFGQALKLQPNSPDVAAAITYIKRRRGKFSEALEQQLKVVEMDPRNPNNLTQLSVTYNILRRFGDARQAVTRAINITPDDAQLHAGLARLCLEQGDVAGAQAAMSGVPLTPEYPYVPEMHIELALIARHYDEAGKLLNEAIAATASRSQIIVGEYQYLLGFTERLAGHTEVAGSALAQARETLTAFLRKTSHIPEALVYAGTVDAMLGDRDSAVQKANAAIAAWPSSVDVVRAPAGEEALARVYAQLGNADAAIPIIERVLRANYLGPEQIVLTPALLRLDPMWDPLRGDPRFQKLAGVAQ